MPWTDIGTLTPTSTWQTFNIPVIGGELFRLSQNWVGDWPGTGYLQFSAVYADAGRYGFTKAQADKAYQIIRLPVLEALLAAGFTTRYIAMRHNTRARLYSGNNWSVSVEQWTE